MKKPASIHAVLALTYLVLGVVELFSSGLVGGLILALAVFQAIYTILVYRAATRAGNSGWNGDRPGHLL